MHSVHFPGLCSPDSLLRSMTSPGAFIQRDRAISDRLPSCVKIEEATADGVTRPESAEWLTIMKAPVA